MTYLEDKERREAARERLRARQARREAAEGAKSPRWSLKKSSNSHDSSHATSSLTSCLRDRNAKPEVETDDSTAFDVERNTAYDFSNESAQSSRESSHAYSYRQNASHPESSWSTNIVNPHPSSEWNDATLADFEYEPYASEQLRNGRVVVRLHDAYTPRHARTYNDFPKDDLIEQKESCPDYCSNDEPKNLLARTEAVENVTGGITSLLQNAFSATAAVAESVRDRFGLKGLVVPVVVLLLLLLLAFQSCSSAPASTPKQNQTPGTSTENDINTGSSVEQIALASIIGEDLATQMFNAAETNEDLKWIATNSVLYSSAGESHQRKLLKLAAEEPEAIPFVRSYPDAYPAGEASGSSSSLDSGTGIPLIYQWDTRWANTEYSGSAFGLTGCCPTSLAMVYQGITRKTDLSPYDMAVLAKKNGFVSESDGTYGDFLLTWGANLGLVCSELSVDTDSLRQALANGDVVIANVGSGDFTEGGHFIVVTGLAENGETTVNDPYSAVNSSKTWSVDTIADQSIRLFLFER